MSPRGPPKAYRPTADSGRANGWRTAGGMWTDRVRNCTTHTLALGPRLRWVWPRALILPLKSGAQSN